LVGIELRIVRWTMKEMPRFLDKYFVVYDNLHQCRLERSFRKYHLHVLVLKVS
jgi:hypothetical protein